MTEARFIGKKALAYAFILIPLFCSFLFSALAVNSGNVTELQNDQQLNASSSVYTDLIVLKAERTINFDDYGLVEVIDNIQIKNNGTRLINTFEYCIHNVIERSLIFYSVKDSKGTQYPVKFAFETMNSYRFLKVEFPAPLLSQAELSLNISTYYKNLFVTESYLQDQQFQAEYTIWINGFPILPYKIADASIRFNAPAGSTQLRSEPSGVVDGTKISHTKQNLDVFEDDGFYFNFVNSKTTELYLKQVIKTIIVNSWGYVTVREEHTIYNQGPNVATGFVMMVNDKVKNITAKDALGEITGFTLATANNSDGTKNLTIDFTQNRPRLLPSNQFSYTMTYNLDFKDVHTTGLLDYSFVYNVLESKYPFLVENMIVKIQIESAWDVKSTNIKPDTFDYMLGKIILEYRFTDVIAPMSMNINVVYSANPLVMHLRPVVLSFLLFIVLFAYVSIRPSMKKEESIEDHNELPVREIRMFIKLYDERIALVRDMENYDIMVKTNKVSKNDYKNFSKSFQLKMKESDKTIREFKQPLIKAGGRVQEIVERLDFLETQIDNNKASLEILEDRYKKGKIPSKTTYQDLYNEIMKKQDKNKKEIDKLLNELKAFLI